MDALEAVTKRVVASETVETESTPKLQSSSPKVVIVVAYLPFFSKIFSFFVEQKAMLNVILVLLKTITVGGQVEKLRVEKSEKPNDPYVIYHKITGYGKEMRYNLLISSNGLVKCFLIENESLWMLAVDHTYQVA